MNSFGHIFPENSLDGVDENDEIYVCSRLSHETATARLRTGTKPERLINLFNVTLGCHIWTGPVLCRTHVI
jgi:hypothetical protein